MATTEQQQLQNILASVAPLLTTECPNIGDLKKKLDAPIDPKLIRVKDQGESGGGKISYYDGETIVRELNERFNYQWSFLVVAIGFNQRARYKEGHPIEAGLKSDGSPGNPNTAKPRWECTGLMIAMGQAKMDMGVGEIGGYGDPIKDCVTDCIKRCARLFGVGLELWDKGYLAENSPGAVASESSGDSGSGNDSGPYTIKNPDAPVSDGQHGLLQKRRGHVSKAGIEIINKALKRSKQDKFEGENFLTKGEASALIDLTDTSKGKENPYHKCHDEENGGRTPDPQQYPLSGDDDLPF